MTDGPVRRLENLKPRLKEAQPTEAFRPPRLGPGVIAHFLRTSNYPKCEAYPAGCPTVMKDGK